MKKVRLSKEFRFEMAHKNFMVMMGYVQIFMDILIDFGSLLGEI